MTEITDFLKVRRSTKISQMSNAPVSDADIETILACGVRVPDHAVLGPWKIIVIKDEGRAHLGAEILRPEFARLNPDTSEETLAFEENRFLRASVVFAVISSPKEHPKIPVWEMELSAGAVCMNLVTAAQSLGYAAQWVTEWYAYNERMLTALGADATKDRFAGFIYVGHREEALTERRRPARENVISYYHPSQNDD